MWGWIGNFFYFGNIFKRKNRNRYEVEYLVGMWYINVLDVISATAHSFPIIIHLLFISLLFQFIKVVPNNL
jgi:hypothetical protein